MYYLKRVAVEALKEARSKYPIIIIYGANGVGKNSLMESLNTNGEYQSISFSNPLFRLNATEDFSKFIKSYNIPLIINEAQSIPNIIASLDSLNISSGSYILLCSSRIDIPDGNQDKVKIINLTSLMKREIEFNSYTGVFNPLITELKKRSINKDLSLETIYQNIFNGSMPAVIIAKEDKNSYYQRYLDYYIAKTANSIIKINDELKFIKFLTVIASKINQMLDYKAIARIVDISDVTIRSWVALLESSNIIFLLEPFSSNLSDRLIKTPRLYFYDTGLCTFLNEIKTSKELMESNIKDEIFKNYVISEIRKSYLNNNQIPNLVYYQDTQKKEVDLLLLDSNTAYPIEIKNLVNPTNINTSYHMLKKFNLNIAPSLIISLTKEIVAINNSTYLIPISLI